MNINSNPKSVPKVPNFSAPMNKPAQTDDGFKIPSMVKEKTEERPKIMSMDKEGRMLDEKGNIIPITVSTIYAFTFFNIETYRIEN